MKKVLVWLMAAVLLECSAAERNDDESGTDRVAGDNGASSEGSEHDGAGDTTTEKLLPCGDILDGDSAISTDVRIDGYFSAIGTIYRRIETARSDFERVACDGRCHPSCVEECDGEVSCGGRCSVCVGDCEGIATPEVCDDSCSEAAGCPTAAAVQAASELTCTSATLDVGFELHPALDSHNERRCLPMRADDFHTSGDVLHPIQEEKLCQPSTT